MSFSLVGTHVFTPDDTQVIIGSVSLEEEDDTIWVRITQNQATGPWPWSYGILGWRSAFGYELGTTKAFAEPQGAVQRLGNWTATSGADWGAHFRASIIQSLLD